MNTGESWPTPKQAEARVLQIQTKLHSWAMQDPRRRFDDLFNLVHDPAFLMVAWRRVSGNRGRRAAGVDGQTAHYISKVKGEDRFLAELRDSLKSRNFRPIPVRERLIPKRSGKLRRLGIPSVRDRVVQACLKLVLEPIFEADFRPCSYGFRPMRRAHDAIAEIHNLCTHNYEWIVEGDIEACFDSIDHPALLGLVRRRIGDKRVLALVKAFLKAGLLTEQGMLENRDTGTPQGGILSPLLANIALSPLDDMFDEKWQAAGDRSARSRLRRRGFATYRLVRYADDFVVLVAGQRHHAEAIKDEASAVLAPMGLKLSAHKTRISHLDEGFDFLGFRIRRHRKRGTNTKHVYTYPTKAALAAVKAKVRTLTSRATTSKTLASILHRLRFILRGWSNYFRHAASARSFAYLSSFTWRRVARWLRKKHPRASWKKLRAKYFSGWVPEENGIALFYPTSVTIVRYRFRGARIPTRWTLPEVPA